MVDMDELLKEWMGENTNENFKLRERKKLLILLAPRCTKYEDLSNEFNRAVFEPVDRRIKFEDFYLEDLMRYILFSY